MTTTREAVVKDATTPSCEDKGFTLQDARLRKRGADVAMLTCTATQDRTCAGKKLPARLVLTAIYVQQKGKRMNVLYQETPLD